MLKVNMASTYGIRRVVADDHEALLHISKHVGDPRIADMLWEDSFRGSAQALTAGFVALFCNPANEVYLLPHDGGVAVFTDLRAGWRGTLYAAVWDSRASHRTDIWRLLCGAVMYVHDLLVIEALVRVDNRACRLAVKRAGFKKVGLLHNALCYGGRVIDAEWYTLSREALRLPAQRGLYEQREVSDGQQKLLPAASDSRLRVVPGDDEESARKRDELSPAARVDADRAVRCG